MRHSRLTFSYNKHILSAPLCCSEDCYDYFMSIWDKKLLHIQEQVYGLYLDGQNQVIAWRCFNTGNSNETLFDIKFVLAVGIGCLASKIVIAHNHPSGILKPSRADINVTARLASVCQLVDIKLEEHLIVSPAFYYSFVDNGVI